MNDMGNVRPCGGMGKGSRKATHLNRSVSQRFFSQILD